MIISMKEVEKRWPIALKVFEAVVTEAFPRKNVPVKNPGVEHIRDLAAVLAAQNPSLVFDTQDNVAAGDAESAIVRVGSALENLMETEPELFLGPPTQPEALALLKRWYPANADQSSLLASSHRLAHSEDGRRFRAETIYKLREREAGQ